ncbi:MAG: GH1 family beta-glucosidase [Kineosporiaceae bacterium]|jgi:beta-glucosidase
MTGQRASETAPEPPRPNTLPPGFLWGAATSAFQIEGDAEHRGQSIWDALCAQPGRIADASDGSVACDHVTRYAEDVSLLRRLGVGAYRFSIAWPRVLPEGTGIPSAEGLGFYDRLVDALLEAGIDPWVTLYHWDLPLPLHEAGGWPDRAVADWFTDYAVAVHAALGDRVRNWATVNEPWCSAWLGYGSGVHAPGERDRARAARASHHLLLAHGRAVTAMRAQAPADHQFGIVLNLFGVRPADGVDLVAAPRVAAAAQLMDGLQNRWWLGALFGSGYPDDVVDLLAADLDGVVREGDLDEIAAPLDFLGVNYYRDELLEPGDNPADEGDGAYPGTRGVRTAEAGEDGMSNGWAVTPDGLRTMLLRIGQDYPDAPPLFVTENGAAYDDTAQALSGDGPVEDPLRVAYLRAHVDATARAVAEGADVRGYFTWSLLDNFEWAEGFTQRFGLIRVDPETRDRRVRRSFEVYRELIAGKG